MNFIKKHLGELMVIIGTGFFVYNIFNFSSAYAYYYDVITLLIMAFGAMLIVGGVIVIKNKK